MTQVKKAPDFDPKATPADGDILPFWDLALGKMVRVSMSQFVNWFKAQFTERSYMIKIYTGFTEFSDDVMGSSVEVTSVVPGAMLNTVQYRKNGGAWTNAYPFQFATDDIVDWKVTFKTGKNSGSFTVNYRKI